jgi:hypothetical protein
MVVKKGSQWQVKSSKGKPLGKPHATKADAVAHLRAIEYFKRHPKK